MTCFDGSCSAKEYDTQSPSTTPGRITELPLQSHRAQHRRLPPRQRLLGKPLQRGLEEAAPVLLGAQMEEGGAQANGGAVHEHELAGDGHRTLALQGLLDLEGFAPAVSPGAHSVGDGAHPVIEQGSVDEPGPDAEYVDEIVREPVEAPGPIGLDLALAVAGDHRPVELYHPVDEGRREDPNAAEVEEIEPVGVAGEAVVAQMRVAVDHPEPDQRRPPSFEEDLGDAVAGRLVGPDEGLEAAPLQPVHGQKPAGGQGEVGGGYGDVVAAREDCLLYTSDAADD